jgi:hypothetical protein
MLKLFFCVAKNKAIELHSIYNVGYAFPEWSLELYKSNKNISEYTLRNQSFILIKEMMRSQCAN